MKWLAITTKEPLGGKYSYLTKILYNTHSNLISLSKLRFSSLLFFLLMYTPFVSAQESIRLDSIIIQGGRLPSSLFSEGKQISILSQQDIRAIPASSLDELLAYVTGVHVTTRNSFGAQADIGIRGSTYAQIVVLIDGQRMNDPLTGHFNSNLSVPIQQINRIEIIRGPASASYGSDAMGGVIAVSTNTYVNYIQMSAVSSSVDKTNEVLTKDNKRSNNSATYSSNVSLKIGSYGSSWQYLDVEKKTRRLIVGGYAMNTAVEGEKRANPNTLDIVSAPANYRSFYNQQSAGISSVFKWTDTWTQYVRMGYDQRDFNAKYFYTISPYDESVEDVQRRWVQFSSRKIFSSSFIEVDGMIQETKDVFDFNPLFTPNEHTTTQSQAHLNWVGKNRNQTLNYTAGIQLLHKKIVSTDRGDHTNLGYGLYGIIRSNTYLNNDFFQSIHTTSSIRADYHDTYKLKWIPQLTLNAITKLGAFRSSAGKSIRAADFTELYVSHNLPSISSGRNVGNPTLEAEESWSIDFNFKSKELANIRYEVGSYYRVSEKLIDYIYTPANLVTQSVTLDPNGYYFYPQNISEGSTFGVEQSVHIRLGLAEHSARTHPSKTTDPLLSQSKTTLELMLSHSYIKTDIDAISVSKYLLEHPKHQWNGQARLKNETNVLLIGLRHLVLPRDSNENMGFQIDSPQTWIDVKASKTLLLPNWSASLFSRMEWSLEMRNSLDRRYQQILGATLPGRWIVTGIRFY